LLTMRGRTVPTALTLFIGLLVTGNHRHLGFGRDSKRSEWQRNRRTASQAQIGGTVK
jgi:hypothetical protein